MVVSKAILDGMSKELLLGREIRAGRIGAAALVAPRIKGIEHGVVGEPQLGLPVEADPPRPLAPFLLDRRIFGISGGDVTAADPRTRTQVLRRKRGNRHAVPGVADRKGGGYGMSVMRVGET